jgi:hypothetical protein
MTDEKTFPSRIKNLDTLLIAASTILGPLSGKRSGKEAPKADVEAAVSTAIALALEIEKRQDGESSVYENRGITVV